MWKALASSFGLTFVAELGDKTQLAILTLSARYGFKPVFLGAALAFVVLNALAVTVGALLAALIPEQVIRYVSAAVFLLFGVLAFRPGEEEDEEEPSRQGRAPFVSAFLLVALMELGDKTQLSLVALTSKYGYPLFVFIGGTAALWLTSLIGAVAGKAISRVVPLRYIRIASGVVFIVFGALLALGVL